MKTIQEMIEVMEAFAGGAKIECKDFDIWQSVEKPKWNWMKVDYRIEPKPKTKLWYWEYHDKNWGWYFISKRQSEAWIKKNYTTYRKIEALGFIEDEQVMTKEIYQLKLKEYKAEAKVIRLEFLNSGKHLSYLKETK